MPFIGSITCQYNINIVFYGIVDSVHGIQFIRQDLPDIVQLLFGGDGELFQIKLCKLDADNVEEACDQETKYTEIRL